MNVFREGVPDLRSDRLRYIPVVKFEGKNCRDRQPWGGFTDPERCECQGPCGYDEQQRVKDEEP